MFYSHYIIPLFLSSILAQDPGFPVPNPSISYWQIPPLEGIADHQSPSLPDSVDVVIVGSGITGASVAHHLLKTGSQDAPLKIAMFEARQACSGATGRNGGHIRPASFAEYASESLDGSKEEAAKLTRFRAAHINALIQAADELSPEGRDVAEARHVDSVTAFWDADEFQNTARQVDILKRDLPDIGNEFTAWNETDAARISLLPGVKGIITGGPKVAGAIWPYRFVTHTLKELLATYPTFSLDTNTPVQRVALAANGSSSSVYEVTTSRGTIRARHVVHVANAWIPHLVPGLQGKISGGKLAMSAHVGGTGLPKAGEWPPYQANGSLPGGRAWDIVRGGLQDYMVQMPRNGEFMLGGGPGLANDTSDPLDDSGLPDYVTTAYFSGAVGSVFGFDRYGDERTDFSQPVDNVTWKGHTKRVWTGIEGIFADGKPLVGRLSGSVTNRPVHGAAKGREWISTSYGGNGMCYAWLCGKALTAAILGFEAGNATASDSFPDWFPMSFAATEDRLNSNATQLARRSVPGRRFPSKYQGRL